MYNAEQYIIDLLNSINRQAKFDLGFEVIIVDDKSDDQSVSIVKSYIDDHRLVNYRLIESENNQGTATARNIGIAAATGTWIQFVDSDDVMQANYFELIAPKLKEQSIDCYIYGTKSTYQDKVISHTPVGNIDSRMIGYKNSVCNKLIRRKLISNFDSAYKFEDVIWLVELINQGPFNCQLIPDLYYQINRQNDQSKMANFNQAEWLKMANAIVSNSKQYNTSARLFVLETFVGTMLVDSIKLRSRIQIGIKALVYNYKYIGHVARDGIRSHDDKQSIVKD